MFLTIGLLVLWQLVVLLGALRLVRFAGERMPRLPRPARVPSEWVDGEWTEDRDPVFGHRTGTP